MDSRPRFPKCLVSNSVDQVNLCGPFGGQCVLSSFSSIYILLGGHCIPVDDQVNLEEADSPPCSSWPSDGETWGYGLRTEEWRAK